jgi:hypothetical protein
MMLLFGCDGIKKSPLTVAAVNGPGKTKSNKNLSYRVPLTTFCQAKMYENMIFSWAMHLRRDTDEPQRREDATRFFGREAAKPQRKTSLRLRVLAAHSFFAASRLCGSIAV